MNSEQLQLMIMTIIFAFPMITSIICGIVTAIYCHSTLGHVSKKLSGLAIALYMLPAFGWGCMIIYLHSPVLFIIVQSLFYLKFTLWHVVLYHIIFFLTGIGKQEKFPRYHYFIPIIIPVILLVWSLFVPIDAQIYIVQSRGDTPPGYEAYTLLFTSKPAAFFLWNFIYTFLAFRRISMFRQAIPNYSADEGHSPTRWLRYIIWLKLSTFLIPLIVFFFGKAVLMGSSATLVPILAITLQFIILCYNIQAENYVLIPSSEEIKNNPETRRIDKAYFEKYICTSKPYLNPKLHIAEMAADLNTNRTYLSSFINSEYGVNFSRYVNLCRLAELEKIQFDPAYRHINCIELVQYAGFTNYRGYLRAKNEKDHKNTPKVLRI